MTEVHARVHGRRSGSAVAGVAVFVPRRTLETITGFIADHGEQYARRLLLALGATLDPDDTAFEQQSEALYTVLENDGRTRAEAEALVRAHLDAIDQAAATDLHTHGEAPSPPTVADPRPSTNR
ncbi:hypothetical protein ACWEKT_32155 [Nocardia takedensis]